jgi:hypothetical protein
VNTSLAQESAATGAALVADEHAAGVTTRAILGVVAAVRRCGEPPGGV